jgi:hypothetical protein
MIGIGILLMIINNLYLRGTGSTVSPVKTNPPLIVNAYAVLPLSISLQYFKPVAGQHGKVPKRDSRVQTIQL